MINLSAANLIGGFVFGSIGFVAFRFSITLVRPDLKKRSPLSRALF